MSYMQQQSSSEQEIIDFRMKSAQNQDISIAYPWYIEKTRKLQDPILRMHNEAIDFYIYTQPTKEEHEWNLTLFEKTKKIVQHSFENVTILAPFLNNRLYLKGTEADCYLLFPQLSQQILSKMSELLSQSMNVNIVPESSQRYDIFEIQIQCQGAKLIIRMLQRYRWEEYLTLIEDNLSQIVEIKFIYAIFNCMVRQRWMNLTLRPYLLFSLISVFYHERRKHKVRTLTENIIKFIQYYGVGPFQERKICYLGKNRYELILENPLPTPFSLWINEKTNIANSSTKELFNLLKNRYRLISNYNFDEEQSIIGLLVNPCKKIFEY